MIENSGNNYVGLGNKIALLCSALLAFVSLQGFAPCTLAATSFNITNLTASNPATAGYTQFSEIRINNAGHVAFIGKDSTAGRSDVFLWDGAVMKNITKNAAEFAGKVGAVFLLLNQKGQVAFIGFGPFAPSAKPFFYDGTSLVNLAPSSGIVNGRAMALNDLGQVAFATQFLGLFFFDGTNVNLVCNASCGFIGSLSINNLGHLAWGGGDDIGFFDGTSVRDLTDDPMAQGAGYSLFISPLLSNTDDISFFCNSAHRSSFLL